MTDSEKLTNMIMTRLGDNVPIRTGQLANRITLKNMKTQQVIRISAIRYNEKAFQRSISKGIQATYYHKGPKGRENEPKGVVKHFRSKTTKYYQYDYAYVTEVRNKSSQGWVMRTLSDAIKEL